ncbi:MAG: hypothetical protein QOF27_1791, partial [Gaiellaceae bacterium]|nr:hypothetical protein [Gaiellaceae bacterium]
MTEKAPPEAPVPLGVVTRQRPSQAPPGTIAVTDAAVTTVKGVGTKHKLTSVASVRFVPVIVTVEPTAPLPGEKTLIVGEVFVKAPSETAVPDAVVTRHLPSQAPGGTVALMEPSEKTVNSAGTRQSETAVAPVKCVPAIVTVEPT